MIFADLLLRHGVPPVLGQDELHALGLTQLGSLWQLDSLAQLRYDAPELSTRMPKL